MDEQSSGKIRRSLPTETELSPVWVDVDPFHWATLTPIVIAPGVMYIQLIIQYPTDEDSLERCRWERLRLELVVDRAYGDLAYRAACGHWLLINHTVPDVLPDRFYSNGEQPLLKFAQ